MRLLALDSAGGSSSAAIWREGEVLAQASVALGHHSEQLLVLVEQCLAEAGVGLAQMDAIACGRGPGAFTGVRLALSVAQGLAYAAGRPVIAVSNLQAAAERATREPGAPSRLLVCHDARMHEVYWAAYERDAGGATRLVGAEAVGSPRSVALPTAWSGAGAAWGVGTGFVAYAAELEPLQACLTRRVPLEGQAGEVARVAARLGLGAAVAAEQAAPVYLRDEVVQAPAPGGPPA